MYDTGFIVRLIHMAKIEDDKMERAYNVFSKRIYQLGVMKQWR